MKRAIAILLGCLAFAATAGAQTVSSGAWSFVTSPRLHPASVRVTTALPGTADGYLFVAPIHGPGPHGRMIGDFGPLILDAHGNPVWAHPLHGLQAMDFRTQMYKGKPVLTWWQGHINAQGIGSGVDVIVDSSYHQIATIRAGNGYQADLHEFTLTRRGTAMITAYKPIRYGNGQMWDSVIQEIDPRTGHVMFQWDPLHHIHLWESYTVPVSGWIWDPYHVNSVDIDTRGNLLVSARNTWGVYKINRRNGGVYWRLGGKASNFKLEPGVRFAYQHDARFLGGNKLSVFDDEAAPAVGKLSRALVLRLDTVHRAAHVVHAYTHPGVLAGSQGNTQVLWNGDVLAGWGAAPYVSEFRSDGALLYDMHFHGPDETYRAFRLPWTGRPHTLPALTLQKSSSGQTTAYASWNGETDIASWQLLAGPSPSQLSPVATAGSSGFETGITTSARGPYYAMRALDASGGVLGASPARQP